MGRGKGLDAKGEQAPGYMASKVCGAGDGNRIVSPDQISKSHRNKVLPAPLFVANQMLPTGEVGWFHNFLARSVCWLKLLLACRLRCGVNSTYGNCTDRARQKAIARSRSGCAPHQAEPLRAGA